MFLFRLLLARHPRDDLIECAVGERSQFFIRPILNRMRQPHDRRLVAECLALRVGGLHERRRRDDDRRNAQTFEIA